jgi:pimeloyl-ACP methyl ester carboxylesterase
MNQARSILAAILFCWLGAPSAADPIAAGAGKQTADLNGTSITVFTYRPAGCADPSLLMIFHGVARTPRGYRDDARALADQRCMLLVAPLFDKRAFPVWRYQQGGIVKDGVIQNPHDWTGRLVLDLADWARQQERRPLSYSLFGHSAGAQFLDRLVAFVPTEARRIVVANAGTYVLASLTVDAPYGLGKVYAGAEGEAKLRRYLEQPLTIYLGEDDTKEADRNDDPDALAQGASRLERGLNTFNGAKALAQARGWPFKWRLVELPGVGHSARKMLAAPQASEALAP